MDGEYITRAEPVPGYIHRMHEKMGENRTYAQFLPNTSRIDYLSAMHYTHAFVGVVERALETRGTAASGVYPGDHVGVEPDLESSGVVRGVSAGFGRVHAPALRV
jgi:hypothetical protein